MSEADELLESLSDESAHLADDTAEPHIIVNSDRTITLPKELQRIAVQYDHNIETVTFDCPRYWDKHDMSKMRVCINYKRQDNYLGAYEVPKEKVTVNAENDKIMHFTWMIDGDVTEVKGNLAFLVCVTEVGDDGTETVHWNSELCQDAYVSEGLECETSIIDRDPHIIKWLLTRMDAVEKLPPTVQVEEIDHGYIVTMTDIKGSHTVKVMNGAVYTPSINEDGVITWTNDQGLSNPKPVNIRGPRGDTGGTVDRNSGKIFQIFIGTQKEWDKWVGDKENVLFLPTDDTTMDEVLATLEEHKNGIATLTEKVEGVETTLPEKYATKTELESLGTAISETYAKIEDVPKKLYRHNISLTGTISFTGMNIIIDSTKETEYDFDDMCVYIYSVTEGKCKIPCTGSAYLSSGSLDKPVLFLAGSAEVNITETPSFRLRIEGTHVREGTTSLFGSYIDITSDNGGTLVTTFRDYMGDSTEMVDTDASLTFTDTVIPLN